MSASQESIPADRPLFGFRGVSRFSSSYRQRMALWTMSVTFLLLSLSPIVARKNRWSRLFWFGDDWDLLNRLQLLGFRRWLFNPFAESFCPIGKLVYGAMVLRPGASYTDFLWATQILRALMFGLVALALRRVLSTGAAAVFAAFSLLYLVGPSGVEVFAWAPQLLTAQSHTFFAALVLVVAMEFGSKSGMSRRRVVLVMVLQALCALSFTRGVVLSGVLALGLVFSAADKSGVPRLRQYGSQLRRKYVLLLVPFVCLVLSTRFARVRNPNLKLSTVPSVFNWALRFYALNPFARVFQIERQAIGLVIALAGLQIGMAIYVYSLHLPVGRLALWVMAAEVGASLAGGVGRFHTGAGAAVASRYQDVPALSFFLLLTVVICTRWSPLSTIVGLAWGIALLALTSQWRVDLRYWTAVRGEDIRSVLMSGPDPDAPMPAVPFISVGRARELVREYQLK
jgi:hypothetical protein